MLYGKHGYMFFSEYSVFDYFPNYNYIYVANEAGEESVTSVNYFRQYYAIFTNKRIKKMSGTFGASDFSVSPLNDFIGCPNGNFCLLDCNQCKILFRKEKPGKGFSSFFNEKIHVGNVVGLIKIDDNAFASAASNGEIKIWKYEDYQLQ